MKQLPKINSLFFLLLLLPGCGKIIDWGKANVNQGVDLPDYQKNIGSYLQSVAIYDQFTTKGIFDALWLSDDVRVAYAELHAQKNGKNTEQKNTFLRRQLEENNFFITFYVLSLYEQPLGNKNSEWSVFLNVDENNYSPIEIKTVELTSEYIEFFGNKLTRFKTAYIVKFDAKDIEDKSIIDEDTKSLSLYFRSVDKEAILTWNIIS